MASCTLVLALRIEGRAAVDAKNQITTGTVTARHYQRLVQMVQRELKACAGGVRQGNLYATIIDSTAALATGNIACTQANAAGDAVTLTYGDVAYTFTEGVDFDAGGSDTACAAALAAAFNAHEVIGKVITATGNAGDCELEAKLATSLMHDWALSTDDATAFGLTQLTGGTEGAAQFALQHFPLNRTP